MTIEQQLHKHTVAAETHMSNLGMVMHRDYHPLVTALQGSQNYGLHHAGSDVDSKYVYMPTLRSLMMGKGVIHTVVMDNGEHVEIRPVQSMIDLWLKGNINALEIMFTGHANVHDEMWRDLIEDREEMADTLQRRILTQCVGMATGKRKSLGKGTVTTRAFVDKHGYDNKDLLHIQRLSWFVDDYIIGGETFSWSLMPTMLCNDKGIRRAELVDAIRNGRVSVDDAFMMADLTLADLNMKCDELIADKLSGDRTADYNALREKLIAIACET